MEFSQQLRRSERLRKKKGIMENEGKSSTNINDELGWSDLPSELLERIAENLSLLELLSFRGVCKDWRLASSTASGGYDSSTSPRYPWLLLYGNARNFSLHDFELNKEFTISIPELARATCIASSGGWLLVYRKESLFFLCPFSRAKIDLPKFPYELVNHIATFSSSPTSPDCIVCVGTKTDTHFVLYVIRRGAKEWAKYEYHHEGKMRRDITCAALCNEIIYFLDSESMALFFSLENEKFTQFKYEIISRVRDSSASSRQSLPFSSIMTTSCDRKLRLKNSGLSTCGTMMMNNGRLTCIYNENFHAEEKKELRQKKGVWIEPRFVQLPPGQSWSL